ncbi:MAG TPA: hypothetical protein VI363_07400, partial [Burkholderiales bacterium]
PRWTSQGAIAGNGNGIFDAACGYNAPSAAPVATNECGLFWWHLRISGFVPGSVVSGVAAVLQPPNAVNGIIGVQTGGLGFSSNIVCSSNMPDKIAASVDTQMDDGTPGLGEVRANLQAVPNPVVSPALSNASAYLETGQNQYVLCKNM